ncbi:2OG-Fe(II) oxygenase [Purpureocillium lavendulum]|uniref:2OG-Fe(II) oxygenase n=1 Tax=Purpureocillium lavendulum TaxID=1247861 RepID=A0AB34G4G2_9HYPO|nr:2OG-Fe(II) oxygenase [Purpureocillium lavendulum]
MEHRTSTNRFACTVVVNGKLVPGYDSNTVKRMGCGSFAGLRSECCLNLGRFTVPSATIHFKIRHANQIEIFRIWTIPLSGQAGDLEVEHLNTEDANFITELLTWTDMDLGNLESAIRATDDSLAEGLRTSDKICDGLDGDSATQPAAEFCKLSSTVRCISMRCQNSQGLVWDLASFDQKQKFTALGKAASRIRDCLNREKVKSIGIYFWSGTSFEMSWLHKLQDISSYMAPYAEILTKMRDRQSHLDLGFNNFVMPPADDRPKHPILSQHAFLSDVQRSVLLVGHAVEEQEMLLERMGKAANFDFQVTVISDPFSKWQPTDSDMNTFGVPADGQVCHQWFVLDMANNDGSQYICNVGDKCTFYLPNVPVQPRAAPLASLTGNEVPKVTQWLAAQLDHAFDEAEAESQPLRRDAEAARQNGDEKAANLKEQEASALQDHHYEYLAGCAFFRILRRPLPEAVIQFPDQPTDVQRAKSALVLAAANKRQPGEDNIAFYNRLQQFVQTTATNTVKEENECGEA